jgi:hypothetical protein
MTAGRLRYSRALSAWDHDALIASLREDVVIRVAVHDEPMQGKQTADFLFGVLRQELNDFGLSDEIVEGDKAVVLFDAQIRGQSAHGLNVVMLDGDGLVRELTGFFRPLPTLQLISEVIGARMAQQFGELPGEPRAE